MFTLKSSTVDDSAYVEEIHDLISEANQASLMAYKSREELLNELTNSQAILAVEDEKVISYCAYKVWTDSLELMSLIVHPDYRKHGIGSALLTDLKDKARRDYPHKELLVLSNLYSTPIVKRLGFVRVEKLSLPPELQNACQGCPEYGRFPQCHCQAHIYPSANATYIEALDFANEHDVQALAEMFCEIWKEPPWYEFFWTVPEVREYILGFAKLPKGHWFAMKNCGRIIGFIAGHEVGSHELAKISELPENSWHELLGATRGLYLAELAVDPAFRSRHLGKALATTQMNYAQLLQSAYLVFRTKNVITERLYESLGFIRSALIDGADPERHYWYKMLTTEV